MTEYKLVREWEIAPIGTGYRSLMIGELSISILIARDSLIKNTFGSGVFFSIFTALSIVLLICMFKTRGKGLHYKAIPIKGRHKR